TDHHAVLLLSCMIARPPASPLFPYTTLFRSSSNSPTTGVVPNECTTPARIYCSTSSRSRILDRPGRRRQRAARHHCRTTPTSRRSEEHTSELQSRFDLVCRLLLEKKNILNQA